MREFNFRVSGSTINLTVKEDCDKYVRTHKYTLAEVYHDEIFSLFVAHTEPKDLDNFLKDNSIEYIYTRQVKIKKAVRGKKCSLPRLQK